MWFDAQAELAKLGGGRESDACTPATLATSATQRDRVAIVADVAPPRPSAKPDTPGPAPYCESPGGRALTWTGRVVSLDAWRALTEWERRGPHGRRWNGITRQWDDV
ncbi:hypothetical protein M8756_02345 [Lutimaribacter sp. EGI FJ00015]|uniref:Uncharacterized protein n=1 Tax=Lutimaribacter degradans TaxID=2945989 RepID=A0ACC5ZTN6_9RHOB|nr:hypothetical protein [Lutimaribacter sp. EGI FJ00013]MCM2560919.1 hypothetical protein [Lutimaribacter sp. EGI FJ00013]MCO0612135.1 hypothetical protein [Lutimaribacter sp. EGI FJ00015]MCO0634745.1 hypothetical protein [Lutimaribacter sp. EGI FJ00014]